MASGRRCEKDICSEKVSVLLFGTGPGTPHGSQETANSIFLYETAFWFDYFYVI